MGEIGSSGRPAGRSLGTLLLVGLLVLSVAAFAATRALRSEADIVNTVVVSAQLDPAGEPASIRFELTRADRRADVLILDESGEPVRALALGVPLEAGPQAYRWDGRADDGEVVPPGDYRIRVVLGDQGREIEPPGTIEVVG
jgi:flagellar hook assembly protein FlgD